MGLKGKVVGAAGSAQKEERGEKEEEEEGGVRENISRNREARTQGTGTGWEAMRT